MVTKKCHQCNMLLELVLGLPRQSFPEPGAAFQCFSYPACALLQGRACFSSMCASNQNLISSGAFRLLVKSCNLALYQVLILASYASLSAHHGQGYPHFLAFTKKSVCSL